MSYRTRHVAEPEWVIHDYLREAKAVVDEAQARQWEAIEDPTLSDDFEHLRWFLLPGEASAELADGQ